MPVHFASISIDMSMVMAMSPIISSVVAALRLLGFWKAGTPLEIASTPVSAAQPEENARSSRNIIARPPNAPKPLSGRMVSEALSASGSVPDTSRNRPTSPMPITLAMKA
jgi:hypothetical protein